MEQSFCMQLIYSLTPDQGFGAGLALAPFQSATEKYSDEVQKVIVSWLIF